MADKRRASTRGKPEGPPKKKVQTFVRERASIESSQPPDRPVEPVPTKIRDSKPLPIIDCASLVGDRPLQSILESGVLAASLSRSRIVWPSEGYFERYWAKPTKKKGQTEPANNPPKDSMQKLGQCRLTIEPLVFDVTLFSIRKWPPAAVQNVSTPLAKPLTSASPYQATGTPSTMASPSGQGKPLLAPVPLSTAPPTTSINQATPKSQQSVPSPTPKSQAIGTVTPQPSLNFNAATVASAPVKPSQDPVIQMLAQRASTSPELKVLMKIVASGSATAEQLKVFQGHIDDLTSILNRQKQMSKLASSASPYVLGPAGSVNSPGLGSFRPALGSSNHQPPPHYTPAPPPSKPKAVPQPKFDITGVAIEFTGSSGDRYLFPKNSILEFSSNGRELLTSFLVVRKGSVKGGSQYEAEKDYYQPVTIRLTTEYSRVLEAISKTVAPYEDVVKHMEDIIAKTTRAEDAQLLMQLPRDNDGTDDGEALTSQTPTAASTRRSFPNHLQTPSTSTPKRISKADDHCQYCFTTVPSSQIMIDGQTTCQSCLSLHVTKSIKSIGYEQRAAMVKRSSGARTLILPTEVH